MLTNEQLQKVNIFYGDLKDEDIIEHFAVGKKTNGKYSIEIKDYTLTESEKELFANCAVIINKFTKIYELYKIFLYDIEDLYNYRNYLEKSLKILNDLKKNNHINFNRYILHILSSGKLFINLIENNIKVEFGKESIEYLEFKKQTKYEYDNIFAYRFLYHLRNYSQHEGLPLAQIVQTIVDNEPNKEANINLFFNPEYLLKSKFNWNNELKNDLKSITNNINIYDLLIEYKKSIIRIYRKSNQIYLKTNHEKLLKIKNGLKKLYNIEENPFIYKITKYNLINYPEKFDLTPLCGLLEINNIYYELNKIGLVNIIKIV